MSRRAALGDNPGDGADGIRADGINGAGQGVQLNTSSTSSTGREPSAARQTRRGSADTGDYADGHLDLTSAPALAAATASAAVVLTARAESEAVRHEAEAQDEVSRTGQFSAVEPAESGGVFRSLKVRNYRLYFTGNVISQTGTWMNRVAQDWLVLQLTHDNAVALGVATALQFGPVLALSLIAGTVADRYDKRRLLIWLQVVLGAVGVALGLAATFGIANIWYVYAACLMVGIAATFDGPTRQSFVMELVGRAEVTNAVALNSMGFNGARIVGPAVAGVLIAITDSGPVMAIAGFGYVAVIISLARMRPSELYTVEPQPRAKGQIRAGLKYIAGRRDLKMVMLLVVMVSSFGMNFQLTLAIMAKIVFGMNASSYGLLTTMLAVGSLFGALVSARRSNAPRLRLLVGAAIAFGAVEIAMGLTGSYALLALLLIPGGAFMLIFSNAANATLQLGTSPEMRSRVMSIYVLAFLGGAPFVSPLVGYAAQWFGGGSPLWIGGSISLLAAIVLAIWVGRSAKMHMELRVRPIPHVHLVSPLAPDEENVSASVARSVHAIAGSAARTVRPAASRVVRTGRMLGRSVARPGRGPRAGGRR
ncbi:MAG: MFS transporter [Nakamurella sp.]